MTPLEIVGGATLGYVVMKVVLKVLGPKPDTVDMEVAVRQVQDSVHEAFQSGMLCAADIATHEGQEELAGRIRMVVSGVRNDK